jgi:capsular polysaccharide transport system ATP-binding protein
MAIEFDCFLIDEAMVVGDIRFHERCHHELFHKRRDRAFVLASHDANVIQRYCESIGVLHGGRLALFPTVDAGYAFYQATMDADAGREEL